MTDLPTKLRALGFTDSGTPNVLVFATTAGYALRVELDNEDFRRSRVDYGGAIQVHHSSVKSFRQAETLVVITCVVSLLKKGYNPALLELEKTWPLGHGTSGRLDILVRDPASVTYAMIECKTPGMEYTRARNKLLEDGGQLFSYFQQDRSAKALYLYSSRIDDGSVVELAEFVRCQHLTGSNVEELHDSWEGTLEPSGIFHPSATLYDDAFRGITKSQLKSLTRETGQGVFHSFAEVLRRHVVSDKPNAFNKIFNLFLCKIADEDEKHDGDEMDFQWRYGDTGENLLDRLSTLYARGLSQYLRIETNPAFHSPRSEFAFIDVFDQRTFNNNIKILREVVELLQQYRVKYSARHQHLGDFFEMLLSTGIKQEAGQFFTPVPLARAVVRALPIRHIIDSKIAARKLDVMPYVVDYACGAGHFLTEAMEEIQRVSDSIDSDQLVGQARTRFLRGREAYGWASEFVFGIEKDHRLSKVTKIATFLNGDGDANIIHADGLAPFSANSGYPARLTSQDAKRLGKIDIVIANPPFSVDNFRHDIEDGASRFRLYKHLSADSGEIECLFLERTSQLLVDGGFAGVFFPLSLLNNGHGVYSAARRLLAIDFEVCGLIELRNKTFIATPTTTVCCFLKRRRAADLLNAASQLLRRDESATNLLADNGIDVAALANAIEQINAETPAGLVDGAYDDDILAHSLRLVLDGDSQTVVAFSGDSVQDQQRALGYRFSKSRGSEGYELFEDNGVMQTMLFDPESVTNQSRFSGAVAARFEGLELDISSDDPDLSRFMIAVPTRDIWRPTGIIDNPSAFFVSDSSVESASPFGDFIDEHEGSTETLGAWLDEGKCAIIRGAVYNKRLEVPRPTGVRILTASNLHLESRRITLQQFRYLSSTESVQAYQRPQPGDVVLCTASGSLKHLGKIAVVTEAIDAYIGGFLTILRCDDVKLRKVLEYNLLSLRFRQLVARAKEQNINNLTEAKLRPFPLHVPSDLDAFVGDVARRESA